MYTMTVDYSIQRSSRRKLNSKLCTIDATRTTFVTKICMTGVLERTRRREIENDLITIGSMNSEQVIWCQGFLYSDETHADHTLFALMKTLASIKEN